MRGSVGAVESQTVCVEPRKATSNQNARPCIVQDFRMWNSSGITVIKIQRITMVKKKKLEGSVAALGISTVTTRA